jgi:hypothetical protein
MALVCILGGKKNLPCTPRDKRSRRLEAAGVTAHSSVHNAVPRLRTTLAACLHMLSTDLCTARIDAPADSLETVRAVR